ncbi:MAG: ArsA family ATPase [Pseudobdellovibrionaceae bacterium]|nr:ArsA family ATPase [Bdellovibrionales bacterium]USN47005.1 MAG: ArsA family ATPase [Pseudobdellovibrionaceae bacterium]
MDDLIKRNKIIVCAGSGGVGKTTVSAALGVRAAELGLRVLVLTIDPAKRLATSLGLVPGQADEVKVQNFDCDGALFAAAIDPEKIFGEFIKASAKNPEAAERLLRNRLYKQLATTFSGSQEFTSLERLAVAAESASYDLVILDTPPAQHALEFLEAPAKIYALFQDSITKWFVGGGQSSGLFQKFVGSSTRTVFRALEKVTGSQFIGELTDFFASIRSVQERVSERSQQVDKLLKSEQTGFVLITGFDEAKLKETEGFNRELKKSGYNLQAVVVNRAFPVWMSSERIQWRQSHEADLMARLEQFYQKFLSYHQNRQAVYDSFQKNLSDQLPLIRIPDMNKDIYGIDGLKLLAEEINKRFNDVAT